MTNRERAIYGTAAIAAGNPDHAANDPQTSLGDTLANILHAADALGLDALSAIATGYRHYTAEKDEPEL